MNVNFKVLLVGVVSTAFLMACTPRHNEWQSKEADKKTPLTEKVSEDSPAAEGEDGAEAPGEEVSPEGSSIKAPQRRVQIAGTILPRTEEAPCETFQIGENLEILEPQIKNCLLSIQSAAAETSSVADGINRMTEDYSDATPVIAAYAEVHRSDENPLGVSRIYSIVLKAYGTNARVVKFTMSNAIEVGPATESETQSLLPQQIIIQDAKAGLTKNDISANSDELVLVLVPKNAVSTNGYEQENFEIRAFSESQLKSILSDSTSDRALELATVDNKLVAIISTQRMPVDMVAKKIIIGQTQIGMNEGQNSELEVTHLLFGANKLQPGEKAPEDNDVIDPEKFQVGGSVNYSLLTEGRALPVDDIMDIDRREGRGSLSSFVYYPNLYNKNISADRKLGRHPVMFKGAELGTLLNIDVDENMDIKIDIGYLGSEETKLVLDLKRK